MTFYKTYALVVSYSLETKQRTEAVELATAELEILRNTPYDNIFLDSTTNPPDGSVITGSGTGLDYDEVKTINNSMYRVLTEIYYVDNPDDGFGGGDSIPNDYKRVNIKILWGVGMVDVSNTVNSIELTSFFVPPSGNESAVIDGILSVNVVDSEGAAVSGATVGVDIVGSGNPTPDFSNTTDSAGNVLFEGLMPGMDMYQITVLLSGSEEIQTMAPYPVSSYYPMYTDASIIAGTITTITIVEDVLPELHIFTKDPFGNVVSDIDFTFSGGRVLGFLYVSNDPVYINTALNAVSSTESGNEGEVDFDADIAGYESSIGKYDFILDESGYVLWKFNPGSDTEQNSISVESGVYNSDMIIIDESEPGVIVSITDSLTTGPFEGVTVQLENTTLGYDVSQQTDVHGKVYFPVDVAENDGDGDGVADDVLIDGEQYNITVTASDYITDDDDSVTISGLESVSIELNPSS
ncbi:MAG: carboxypeptidase-like regulatory domain-containing protein [Candidatus Moraniibacteriota bacterium]